MLDHGACPTRHDDMCKKFQVIAAIILTGDKKLTSERLIRLFNRPTDYHSYLHIVSDISIKNFGHQLISVAFHQEN